MPFLARPALNLNAAHYFLLACLLIATTTSSSGYESKKQELNPQTIGQHNQLEYNSTQWVPKPRADALPQLTYDFEGTEASASGFSTSASVSCAVDNTKCFMRYNTGSMGKMSKSKAMKRQKSGKSLSFSCQCVNLRNNTTHKLVIKTTEPAHLRLTKFIATPATPKQTKEPKLQDGQIAGITLGLIALLALIIAAIIFWRQRYMRRKRTQEVAHIASLYSLPSNSGQREMNLSSAGPKRQSTLLTFTTPEVSSLFTPVRYSFKGTRTRGHVTTRSFDSYMHGKHVPIPSLPTLTEHTMEDVSVKSLKSPIQEPEKYRAARPSNSLCLCEHCIGEKSHQFV